MGFAFWQFHLPYFLAAFSIAGSALARSSGSITGWNSTLALNAKNHGSAYHTNLRGSCGLLTIQLPDRGGLGSIDLERRGALKHLQQNFHFIVEVDEPHFEPALMILLQMD